LLFDKLRGSTSQEQAGFKNSNEAVRIARKVKMNRLLGIEGFLVRLNEDDTGMCSSDNKMLRDYINELQDKLSRRNMQIKDLKKEKENLQATLGEAVYFINQKGFYPEFDKSLTTRH